MGIGVLVLGASGSGKSTSMRNFKPDEIGIINVQGKPLPFKNSLKTATTDDYTVIMRGLKEAKTDTIVIDDAQYLMANEFMRRANEKGYDKFTEIGQHFWTLVNMVKGLPENKIVYFMQHIDLTENGFEKAKTIGKMLDEKICLEGMFTIVLKAVASDGQYIFRTATTGNDSVKTPMGMFAEAEIDNDLKLVDDAIRSYFNIPRAKITTEGEKTNEKTK